jgi:FixJ family two-component response regulator
MKSNGAAPVIVLVDDDAALLNALKFAFETDGFAVAVFPDAETLLATPRGKSACFVLDQNLPGMSGLDLLDRLRAGGEAAPAILITSHPPFAVRERARAAGVEMVDKPLLGDALGRAVKRLIDAHG